MASEKLVEEIVNSQCVDCPLLGLNECHNCDRVVTVGVGTLLGMIDLINKTDKVSHEMAITLVQNQLNNH